MIEKHDENNKSAVSVALKNLAQEVAAEAYRHELDRVVLVLNVKPEEVNDLVDGLEKGGVKFKAGPGEIEISTVTGNLITSNTPKKVRDPFSLEED